GIGGALAIFGVGSVISVLLAARFIDAWLRGLIVAMLALGAISMLLLLAFAGIPGIAHLAFFLWGISFGPLVTMYQAAVARRVDRGRDVATSLQSSVFNFSIMVASWIGGVILVRLSGLGVTAIVWLAPGCFAAAAPVAWGGQQALRCGGGRSLAGLFPRRGCAADDPLDDCIEAHLVERVAAVDAKFGDEVAADPGHDLVGIPRVLVPGTRDDHRWPRSDGCEDVVRVHPAG